jgi:hypothetical protein
VRVTVLTGYWGDGGATVFREADGAGNGGISGGATSVAHGCGQGELGAGIGQRNSEDGSGRQGAAALILVWRSGQKRLNVAEVGCGTR